MTLVRVCRAASGSHTIKTRDPSPIVVGMNVQKMHRAREGKSPHGVEGVKKTCNAQPTTPRWSSVFHPEACNFQRTITKCASKQTQRRYKLVLETPADLERSELDVISFVLISDIDALDSCGRRATVNGPFTGTTTD